MTVFFFLSGFLITTLLRLEYDQVGHISIRSFYLRRVLRIFPPFYVVLIATIIATILWYPTITLLRQELLVLALQFHNYWMIYRGNDTEPMGTVVYWSLSVEEHFYLVFPFFYIAMRKARLSSLLQACVLWVICAAVLLWRYYLVVHQHSLPIRTYVGTDTRIDSILFGCALAVWRNPAVDQLNLREVWWKWCYFPSTLLVLYLCFTVRNPDFRETLRYSLQGVALNVVFVAAMRFPTWSLSKFLNWAPMELLGQLSYSLYLMHYLIISLVMKFSPDFDRNAQAVEALSICLALAWLMRVVIEEPCAKLRRQLSAGR